MLVETCHAGVEFPLDEAGSVDPVEAEVASYFNYLSDYLTHSCASLTDNNIYHKFNYYGVKFAY